MRGRKPKQNKPITIREWLAKQNIKINKSGFFQFVYSVNQFLRRNNITDIALASRKNAKGRWKNGYKVFDQDQQFYLECVFTELMRDSQKFSEIIYRCNQKDSTEELY